LCRHADVNHARGLLHLHGSPKQQPVPVQIQYNRPDEAMHVRLGAAAANNEGCVLVFDAQAASDASLHPIPGGGRQVVWLWWWS
jgi:hypothetical protein